MNAQGWAFLLGSWAVILGVFAWGLVRVLGRKEDGDDGAA